MRRASNGLEDIYVVGKQLPHWRLRLIQLDLRLKATLSINGWEVEKHAVGIVLMVVIAAIAIAANPFDHPGVGLGILLALFTGIAICTVSLYRTGKPTQHTARVRLWSTDPALQLLHCTFTHKGGDTRWLKQELVKSPSTKYVVDQYLETAACLLAKLPDNWSFDRYRIVEVSDCNTEVENLLYRTVLALADVQLARYVEQMHQEALVEDLQRAEAAQTAEALKAISQAFQTEQARSEELELQMARDDVNRFIDSISFTNTPTTSRKESR